MGKIVTAEFLVADMRKGAKWMPVRWRNAELLNNGYCHIKRGDPHTFIEHTPKTVGFTVSPAIDGAREAIEKYGNVWEAVAD